jgi:protein-tyrosine phosphatase
MQHIEHEIEIDAPADVTWKLVGDTGAISTWLPALTTSVMDGDLRRGTMGDGSVAVERIVNHSDADRTYSYEIVEAPLALEGYLSTLSVEELGERSRVRWSARFEADDELRDAVSGMYADGLSSLARHLSTAS